VGRRLRHLLIYADLKQSSFFYHF